MIVRLKIYFTSFFVFILEIIKIIIFIQPDNDKKGN